MTLSERLGIPPRPSLDGRRLGRRRRLLAVLAAGVLVVIALAFGVVVWNRADDGDDADASAFCERLLHDSSDVGRDPYERFQDLADEAPDEIADDIRWFGDAQRFNPSEREDADVAPASFDSRVDELGGYEQAMAYTSSRISGWVTDNCDPPAVVDT